MKIIDGKNWLKSEKPKISVPIVKAYFSKEVNSKCLVDTGSSVNLLSQEMLNILIRNKIVKKVYATEISCYSACNNSIQLIGKCFVRLKIGNNTWSVEFNIAKNFAWNVLLGVNFI
ncbi:MAG: retroviral-like aspartic protease, partial [Gammaproteobacteria bacterium]